MTAPPVATSAKTLIKSAITNSTSETAETALLPMFAAIIEPASPTEYSENCSIAMGKIALPNRCSRKISAALTSRLRRILIRRLFLAAGRFAFGTHAVLTQLYSNFKICVSLVLQNHCLILQILFFRDFLFAAEEHNEI